ncbi:MAG TPA: hypothetical protein VMR33_00805 [Candidatus Baltobacteraceae bacterium]|jgi:hypothetical protein|nr:hypothetical protein [Candidatus Baltobacteraceae bacterium]
MTGEFFPFGSRGYVVMCVLLLCARGMDFLSTWVATPNLVLEGNPLAKKLGWKWGALVNLALCVTFAFWPLTAIIVITAGLLVAAHNFHAAWLMRSMGEDAYREWFSERIAQTRMPLYLACLLGETFLTGVIGGALILFSEMDSVAFAIGFGIVAYSVIVLFYTLLSLWRLRRPMG